MPKRTEGLHWIKKSDALQVQWASDYLQKKGLKRQKLPFKPETPYEALIADGQAIERQADGISTLQAMRAAWRQKEYRSDTDRRRAYTFTLPTETKLELDSQAKKNEMSANQLLIKLISDSTKLHASLKESIKELNDKSKRDRYAAEKEINQHKQTKKLTIEMLNASIRESCLLEVCLRDAKASIEAITIDQEIEVEMMFKARVAEANAEITEKYKSLNGWHNVKAPMERPVQKLTFIDKETKEITQPNQRKSL